MPAFRSPEIALPPFSLLRDARSHGALRRLGLAGAWNFLATRFTAAGRGLLLASGAFFLWGVNSLEMQAHVPLLYVACWWVLAFLFLRFYRPRVAIETRHPARIAAGETLLVRCDIAVRRAFAARISPLNLPAGLDASEEGAAISTQNGARTFNFEIVARRRGVYSLNGWRVASDYPFGILRACQIHKQESRLVVTPSFTSLARLEIVPGRRFQPGGAQLLSHSGASFEFAGNRDYREGDSVRDIDWRATARLQKAVVREWREEYFLRAAVVLDTQLVRSASASQRDDFERAVSLCAAIADYLARENYVVDLLAAGAHLYHLQTGPHAAFLDEILDILAVVESDEAEPFPLLQQELAPQLGGINTLVAILLDWDETRAAWLESIAREGVGVRAFVVRDRAATLDVAASAQFVTSVPRAAQANDAW